MAVQIALQCSDSDAHLILNDDNPAARLLSRLGEAIYNDANGLAEGNNFFQVVWLLDDRREHYLASITQLARLHNQRTLNPQIVFEGNIPSNVARNQLLNQLLDVPAYPESTKGVRAWIGSSSGN